MLVLSSYFLFYDNEILIVFDILYFSLHLFRCFFHAIFKPLDYSIILIFRSKCAYHVNDKHT